jgi:thiamine kinase-like enzyme
MNNLNCIKINKKIIRNNYIMEMLEEYDKLLYTIQQPDNLKQQIHDEMVYYQKHKKNRYLIFKKYVEQIFSNKIKPTKEQELNLFRIFVDYYSKMPLNYDDMTRLYIIDNNNNKLYFKEDIVSGPKQNVFLVQNKENKEYVVKWITKSEKTIIYEIMVLKMLKKMDTSIYYFNDNFTFWGFPVLCMEKLDSLDSTEDEYDVGYQVLKVLKKLHTFGVHNDIKISNIMKKHNKIYLIDFEGISIEPMSYGYKRKIWSRKWTSQPYRVCSVSTAKNDFLELGYVMKGLQLMRNKIKLNSRNIKRLPDDTNSKLYIYMQTVLNIDDKNIPHNIHNILMDILHKKN